MDSPTFIYDGDCAFCTSSARYLQRHVSTPARILPWQSLDLPALGLTRAQVDAAAQWVGPDGVRAAGPDAFAELLVTSTRGWRLLGLALRMPPVRLLAWPVYNWIARNRHRMPGGTAACALPPSRPDATAEPGSGSIGHSA